MQIIENENLSKYTTVGIGGNVKEMVIPESRDELLSILKEKKPKYILGGGSNLLIAEHEFEYVLNTRKFDVSIEDRGEGEFNVGASLRLQKLIDFINEAGYGGIEYLYSVPGLVGGAVVMNAGRGKSYNKSISDYIVEIEVYYKEEVKRLKKHECSFSYRDSIFKGGDYVILSVVFKFPRMSKEESSRLKQERLALCRKQQDNSAQNFGSVFCECNDRIMGLVSKIKLQSGNVFFSSKTRNWLLNKGGTYSDVINVMKKVEKIHKIFGKKINREIVIWN